MNGIEKRIDTIEGLEHKDYIVATVEGIGDLVLEKLKNY